MKIKEIVSIFLLSGLFSARLFAEPDAPEAVGADTLSYEELQSRFERLKTVSKTFLERYRALEHRCKTLEGVQEETVALRSELTRVNGELEKKSRQLMAQTKATEKLKLVVDTHGTVVLAPARLRHEEATVNTMDTDRQMEELLERLVLERENKQARGNTAYIQPEDVLSRLGYR